MIFRRATFFLLVLGIVLGGCTDPTSIDPYVSDETWTPAIELGYSNYRRVEVRCTSEPSLDVERNLSRIRVQYRRAGQGNYAPLDSIDYCGSFYRSGPVLKEDVDYELRMKADYQKGSTTTSNVVPFTSPVVKGQRLDTIAATRFAPNDFQFTEDNVYLYADIGVGDYALIRIDRVTEDRTVLLENFGDYDQIGVHSDTLLAASAREDEMLLSTVDLQTREVVTSEPISPPMDGRDVEGALIHYDGTNAHVLWRTERGDQIQVLDAGTGEVVTSYPQLEGTLGNLRGMVYDGSQYWISFLIRVDDFENRIASIDPSSGEQGAVHQNPVFDTSGLAWGGDRFWVYDWEIKSLVKIKLNGI